MTIITLPDGTLIRQEPTDFAAGTLRDECPYCGGTGTFIGGDEIHTCFCIRDQEDQGEL